MVSAASRRARGNATQSAVARWFASHGWPHAESAGAGRPGVDVTGTPGLAIEVKARRDLRPLEWVRQAATRTGLPIVVFRPDGIGEKSIADWPCLVRLEDLTALLRDAGYGWTPDADYDPWAEGDDTSAQVKA